MSGDTPWDRLKGETSRAYEAFVAYRELGPGRSLEKTRQKTGKKDVTHLEDWSARYDWVDRATAYDDHLEEKTRDSRESALLEMVTRHASLATKIQDRAVLVLDAMLKRMKDHPDEIEAMSDADLVRWVETGIRLERQAAGAPDQVVKQSIDISGDPLIAAIVEDEELEEMGLALTARSARVIEQRAATAGRE